jgi:hypothetical protein
MMRQFHARLAQRACLRVVGKGAGHGPMEPDTFAREQFGVDGLLEQDVPEPVLVADGAQYLAVDRFTCRRQQPILRELRGGGKQLVLGWSPNGGDQPKDVLGVFGQCRDARQEEILKSAWQRLSALGIVDCQQFFGEERVAV